MSLRGHFWCKFIDIKRLFRSGLECFIRKHTMTGRPLGGSVFIQKLETMLGIRLHALSVGRPSKSVNGK